MLIVGGGIDLHHGVRSEFDSHGRAGGAASGRERGAREDGRLRGGSILTGLAVSVSGSIGYVGLLVPHVMRMIFGTDYRLLIPTSALGGAILIVVADMLARTVVAPTELPVGAMTAIAGAPVFIYLMRRRVR